jgi:hypothetical protein
MEYRAFPVSPSKNCNGEYYAEGLGHVVIVPTHTSYEEPAQLPARQRGGRGERPRRYCGTPTADPDAPLPR